MAVKPGSGGSDDVIVRPYSRWRMLRRRVCFIEP
jgi:hypothetical protein